jgi:hypothetical protein
MTAGDPGDRHNTVPAWVVSLLIMICLLLFGQLIGLMTGYSLITADIATLMERTEQHARQMKTLEANRP